MKAQIFLDGKLIFKSNKISQKNLDKIESEISIKENLNMPNRVERGFKIFTTTTNK